MKPGLARRDFLRTVAAAVVALPLASLTACGDPPPPPLDSEYAEILAAYFGADALADARAIGARYLEALGSDDAAEVALGPTRALLDAQPDAAGAVAVLQAAVTVEFAGDRFYDLDGWILSPTELALCALVTRAWT